MTYQLGNFTGHCLRATATGQAGQSEPARSLWQRAGAWIAKRFGRPASRSASHGELYRPDWSRQLQHDLLRIQARRIL
jgi:hypothetical protein